jgi:soluble lytic murein transglycosylase-like protein
MMRRARLSLMAPLSGFVIGVMATLAYAGTEPNSTSGEEAIPGAELAAASAAAKSSARTLIRALIEKETLQTNLPSDVAEAVVFVESSFNMSTIGRVGEIGLMQVRPGTAAMLGFKGSIAELAKPEVNIHYGVTYLSQAWRLAGGDLCRALMKYRAGHGQELMSPLSVTYCDRARLRLIAMGSPYSGPGTGLAAMGPTAANTPETANTRAAPELVRPTDVYATYRRGTPAASRAFWAAHEARIRAISASIESKWRRLASR